MPTHTYNFHLLEMRIDLLILKLNLNNFPLYYQLVQHGSQQGYFPLDVQSCTFTFQYYMTDIPITSTYLHISSTYVKGSL